MGSLSSQAIEQARADPTRHDLTQRTAADIAESWSGGPSTETSIDGGGFHLDVPGWKWMDQWLGNGLPHGQSTWHSPQKVC